MTLSWNDPDDSSLTRYQYQRKEADGPFGRWTDLPGSGPSTTSYTVTRLTNGVTYTFGVRAVDTSGASDRAEVSASPLPRLPLQPTGLSADVDNAQITVNWDEPAIGSPPITKYQLLGLLETRRLIPKDGVAYDRFGYAVAVDDNTAVIGAHGKGAGAGSVYVYTKGSSGSWRQTAKLIASDGEEGDNFGISVALDGDTDTVVVGAYGDDQHDNRADSGSVYVYTKNPRGVWVQAAKLVASDAAEGHWFGYAVAVDDNTVLIGAPQDNHNNNDDDDLGSAYVYTKDPNGAWRQTAKLTASDGAEGDNFGISVAVDGNTAVIGAHGTDRNDADTGSAYVFTKNPDDAWSEQTKLVASDGAAGDRFGISVAVEGDTAVIGAYGDDDKRR